MFGRRLKSIGRESGILIFLVLTSCSISNSCVGKRVYYTSDTLEAEAELLTKERKTVAEEKEALVQWEKEVEQYYRRAYNLRQECDELLEEYEDALAECQRNKLGSMGDYFEEDSTGQLIWISSEQYQNQMHMRSDDVVLINLPIDMFNKISFVPPSVNRQGIGNRSHVLPDFLGDL